MFRCEHCGTSVNSQQQFEQHQGGKGHIRKLMEKGIDPSTVAPPPPKKPVMYGRFVTGSDSAGNIGQSYPPPPPPPPPGDSTFGQTAKSTRWGQQTRPEVAGRGRGRGILGLVPTMQSQPGKVDPVQQAVVDFAMGKTPTKRKAYEGKCDVCKITFNSSSQESQHYSGSKHAKKMRMAGIVLEVQPGSTGSASLTCVYCKIDLNSVEQMEQHKSGTKHKRKVEALINPGANQTVAAAAASTPPVPMAVSIPTSTPNIPMPPAEMVKSGAVPPGPLGQNGVSSS